MVSHPVLTPKAFSGEGSWDDWLDHFESVAEVNKWDKAAKLLWLRVRMTGRAQTAYKQLSDETRADYDACVQGLRERFEPETKKELYLAEFQARTKRPAESWAAFAEDLKVLASKAFPKLQDDAKELLALTQYLGQLDNIQISFGVKQKRPKTLDEAVSATLELESYLIKPHPPSSSTINNSSSTEVVAGVQKSQETMVQMLSKMMDRLDKLEAAQATPPHRHPTTPCQDTRQRSTKTEKKTVVCLKCGNEGHYAKGCATPRSKSGN